MDRAIIREERIDTATLHIQAS